MAILPLPFQFGWLFLVWLLLLEFPILYKIEVMKVSICWTRFANIFLRIFLDLYLSKLLPCNFLFFFCFCFVLVFGFFWFVFMNLGVFCSPFFGRFWRYALALLYMFGRIPQWSYLVLDFCLLGVFWIADWILFLGIHLETLSITSWLGHKLIKYISIPFSFSSETLVMWQLVYYMLSQRSLKLSNF